MFYHSILSKVLTNGELVRLLHNLETKIEELRVSDSEKQRTISVMQEKIERLENRNVFTLSLSNQNCAFKKCKISLFFVVILLFRVSFTVDSQTRRHSVSHCKLYLMSTIPFTN